MESLNSTNLDIHKYNLFCPLCSQRLEPLIVDTTGDDEVKEETVWWTCQGVRTRSCDFPLSMPSNVFWTKRNAQQIESDVIPPPNFHLLPPKFHHLYSAFFQPVHSNPERRSIAPSSSSQVLKRKATPTAFPQRPAKVIRSKLVSATKKPPPKPQQTPGNSLEKCLELLDSRVLYLPDVEIITARMGKKYNSSQKAAQNNQLEWKDMGLARDDSTMDKSIELIHEHSSDNLPSCSSRSSGSPFDQNNVSFSEAQSLHVESLGDMELDGLVRDNLVGILSNKKLRKRRKRVKGREKEQIETEAPAVDHFNSYVTNDILTEPPITDHFTYAADDEFGNYDFATPWL